MFVSGVNIGEDKLAKRILKSAQLRKVNHLSGLQENFIQVSDKHNVSNLISTDQSTGLSYNESGSNQSDF